MSIRVYTKNHRLTSGLSTGKTEGSTGFTLIELLVVIAIIMLVAAISIAAVTPFLKGQRLKSGARTVQAIIVRAKSYAVSRRSPHRVVFRINDNKIDVQDKNGNIVGKTLSLPEHVQVSVEDRNGSTIGNPIIRFAPNGTATVQNLFDEVKIVIMDSGSNETLKLTFYPFTGRLSKGG